MARQTKAGFDEGKIDFVGKVKLFAGISFALFAISLVIIATKGLNYGIDFVGGTEIQVKFQQKMTDNVELRKLMKDLGIENVHIQRFGEGDEYLVRYETIHGATETETNKLQNDTAQKITNGLKTTLGNLGPEIRRVDAVGPQVGGQMKRNALLAIFYSLLVILIYVGLRFDYEFAPGAVVCLLHDAVITVGVFSLIGKEINVQILAAVLTIIGYSMNDTIVVYDRIRENLHVFKDASLAQVINRSTNDTIHRTILTSMTVMITCVTLFALAGGVISDFAFAMMIGVIVGTYSSIYVASPLIIVFDKLSNKNKAATA